MFLRSYFCCCPVHSLAKKSSRGKRSSLNDIIKPSAAIGLTTTKRKYRFHNSVVRHISKRNKNRKKISLNHTMFVVPTYIPPGTPTIIE